MRKNWIVPMMLLVLAGCQKPVKNAENSNETIRVTTYRIAQGSPYALMRYSGTVEAYRTVPLTFQVSGIVQQVFVDEGDRVKKGQLLATVDATDYENVYKASLAKYEQAKDAYDRLKTVHEQGSLPEIKWVEITTGLEQARSSMELARNNLNKCQLYAPEDGFIGKRNIEPGQSSMAVTSAPLELVKIEKVYVKISVPEHEVNQLKVGLKARFTVEALNGQSFEGTITSISPVADILSRTYTAKILVSNPNYTLKPGMVCDVVIEVSQPKAVVLIPYRAVTIDDKGEPFVFTIDSNKKVHKHNIRIGRYAGSQIEVLDGLQMGDLIVVDGKDKLSENQMVAY